MADDSAMEAPGIEPSSTVEGSTEQPATGDRIVQDSATAASTNSASDSAGLRFENLQPGDVVVSTPDVAGTEPPVVVTTPASSGDSGRASIGGWSQTALYAGAGLALLAGLLFFGRRLRQRFGSVAVNAPSAKDDDTEDQHATTIVDDVDFDFEDTINAAALSLDADLDAGTGLEDGENPEHDTELEVSREFTFDPAARQTTEVDLEITEEAAAEPEIQTTDVIPPTHKIEEATILDDEVVPEADDYEVSMIVDATKQSIDYDDATARDLQAVPVDDDLARTGEYAIADDMLATESDLKALELDYEEEFTQTQALNAEIEQAAQELAARLDPAELADALQQDADLEPTREMPASNDDTDSIELTAELTANLPMDVDAPLDIDAVNDDLVAGDEITSKMAAAGSDVTVEMQVESGKVDTTEDA
jgi:hypothetical protein